MYLLKGAFLVFVMAFSITSHSQNSNKTTTSLKFGKGLNINAADSSMQLKISFRFQPLFDVQKSLTAGAKASSGIVIRRSRLKFEGWAYQPNIKYKAELALAPRDLKTSTDAAGIAEGIGAKVVLDAVLKWKFHNNLTLWAGQTKLPGNRERLISSQKLQFVDRSLVNSKFTLDRDVGIQLHGNFKIGKKAVLKPVLALSMGEGKSIVNGNTGGYQYTGKLEFFPLGNYDSSKLTKKKKAQMAFGLSYNIDKDASREQGTLKKFLTDSTGMLKMADLNTLLAEMTFRYNGFSTMVEYAKRTAAVGGLGFDTGSGLTASMGYLFANNFELALRYTNITPDSDKAFKTTDEYTFGLSKYIVGHNLKVQTDVSLIEEEGASDPSIRYRFQFEFAF